MGRSVKGEGRRRGRSKKRENRENLDAKPFLDPDPASPSLDELDPGGKGEATARAAEEVVSFIASSVIPNFYFLCRVKGTNIVLLGVVVVMSVDGGSVNVKGRCVDADEMEDSVAEDYGHWEMRWCCDAVRMRSSRLRQSLPRLKGSDTWEEIAAAVCWKAALIVVAEGMCVGGCSVLRLVGSDAWKKSLLWSAGRQR
ncbi:hypothetical protein GW17_00059402 [Ensete ventricosum]|nr:hypothetical protein GW17_00059402 [Ensete ventricosum]